MFPAELTKLNQWVCHRSKVPVDAKTGNAASSTDPTTWASYEEAEAGVKKWGCDGVGFVITPPYAGIDLDHCVENGVINEFAQKIVDSLRSYTEFSPSNTGLHILVKGDLPYGALKTGRKDAAGKVVGEAIEVYNSGRYFTMTNRRVPLSIPVIRQADVSFLYPEDRKTQNGTKPKAAPIVERLASISEGNRNSTFLSLAGSLRSSGKLDNITIFELLKPRAKEADFDEKELWHICNKYPDAPKSQGDDDDSFGSFMADRKPVEWLVQDVIAKQALGFFVGLPQSCKTFMAMDLALELAKGGGKWLGRFPVKAARVFLIDQERGKQETQRRLDAMMQEKGLTATDVGDRLVVKCGTTFRLDNQQSVEGLLKKLRAFRPDVLIWDSWITALSNSDEKDRGPVQRVIEQLKMFRTEFDCTIIIIDHESKSAFQVIKENEAPNYGNQAGSIAKPAAAEFSLTIRSQSGVPATSWVYHVKSTQGPSVAPFQVRVRDVTPDKSKIVTEAF